jgi:hypothetical protein
MGHSVGRMNLRMKYSFLGVLLAFTMKNTAFWDIMPCNLVEVYQSQQIVFFKYNFMDELYGIC